MYIHMSIYICICICVYGCGCKKEWGPIPDQIKGQLKLGREARSDGSTEQGWPEDDREPKSRTIPGGVTNGSLDRSLIYLA